ncbi:MAG: PadR family transcriptional regulator [Bacteroidota bacterium]
MDNIKLNRKEIAILGILIGEDCYGYELVKKAGEKGETLMLGGLYNIMKSLTKKELVESYWGDDSKGRGGSRRRYYKITGKGENAFTTARKEWIRLLNMNTNPGFSL